MAQLTYTIPDGKAGEYISDYCYIHKNIETIDDPEWIDPEDGTIAPQVPKYTDAQWVREHILRFIRTQVKRGKVSKHKDAQASLNTDDIV